MVTGRAVSSHAAGTRGAARIATVSVSGGLGLGAGAEHPLYWMLTLAGLVIVALGVVVLVICICNERSERLYRWARLILGREEPKSPQGSRGGRTDPPMPLGAVPDHAST